MRPIDIRKLADDARFNRFHGLVLCWCALIIIFDGYDLAVAGIALPLIMKQMGVDATSAGFMVSAALFGMMFGAVGMGSLADRIGRRRTIAICIALFSVFTALAGLTNDPVSFSVTRFLAGIGIGGVMPNVVAQMTDFSPRKIRSMMVTLMFSGYSVGGVLAALLGKGLIEAYGWQSVFIAAGFPVLIIPAVLKFMPESMEYLSRLERNSELRAILVRMEPSFRSQQDDLFVLDSRNSAASTPISRLFQDGRGFSTAMIWVAFFMCLFMVYALSTWLTKLMAASGFSLGSALTFVLVLNFGSIVGAIGGGWLADRFNMKYVLVGMYTLAASSISAVGYSMPTSLLLFMVGVVGASTLGTQIVTYAYVGQYYPAAMRGTGIGWASGVGRGGAILAPVIIGVLVGSTLPLQQKFFALAVPALIAVIAILLIDHRRSDSVRAAQGVDEEIRRAALASTQALKLGPDIEKANSVS